MIELTFLKKLIIIKQVYQKNVIFITIGIFYTKYLSFNSMSDTDVTTYE